MELKINSWKSNTPPNVNHRIISDYIQDTAAKFNIPECTLYNTRVEHVSKIKNLWRVQTTSLAGRGSKTSKKTKTWVGTDPSHMDSTNANKEFNFLVVATGHYHACKVPDIPGLKKWKTSWAGRVKHSKGYRSPEEYENQVCFKTPCVTPCNIVSQPG
jgi:ACS family pantothenate transporter-like MFS transporter